MRETEIRQSVSRQEFMLNLMTQEENIVDLLVKCQSELYDLEKTRRRIEKAEEIGYDVEYYFNGEDYCYHLKDKEKVGFV